MILIIEFSLLIGAALGVIHAFGDAVDDCEQTKARHDSEDKKLRKTLKEVDSRQKKSWAERQWTGDDED